MKLSYDYIKYMPKTLPKGLLDHIRDVILPQDNILIYERDNPRKGYCYLCGSSVTAKGGRFSQNHGLASCPNCGKLVQAVISGGTRFEAEYIGNVAALQKGKNGIVWIREWHIIRDRRKGITKDSLQPIEAWAISGRDVFKWAIESKVAWSAMNYDRVRGDEYFTSKRIVYTLDGFYNFYLPRDYKEIVEESPLKYLNIEEVSRKNVSIIRLMVDFVRYPAIEKLYKAGFVRIVYERLAGMDSFRDIKWKKDNIEDAIGFPLYIADTFSCRNDLTLREVSVIKYAYGLYKDGKIREADMRLFVEHGNKSRLKELWPVYGHASCEKIFNYAARLDPGDRSSYSRWSTYRDYLNDCVALQLDLNDRSVLFPKDLNAAHQRTIEMVKYKENEQMREAFKSRVARLSAKALRLDSFLIRPAASEEELIQEGRALHHCVGGYAKRIAKGKTAIFLIRRTEDPETPFYTLEYNNKRIVQCRTLHNRSYTTDPEVVAFTETWLRYLKEKKVT